MHFVWCQAKCEGKRFRNEEQNLTPQGMAFYIFNRRKSKNYYATNHEKIQKNVFQESGYVG